MNNDETERFLATKFELRIGGPTQKIWFFQMVPKSFLSGLIYSTRCEYDILKFMQKQIIQNPLAGCIKLVQEKWSEKFLILEFAGFSSCVPLVLTQEWYFKCLNTNTMLLWLNNNKMTLDLFQSLIWIFKTHLLGASNFFGTVGRQKCWFLPSFPVVCYLCRLINGTINIGNHHWYILIIE